jgi:hypothetical protein
MNRDQFIFFTSPFDELTTLALNKSNLNINTLFQCTEMPSFAHLSLFGSPRILSSFKENDQTFIFIDHPIHFSLFQILHLISESLPFNTIKQLISNILQILTQRHQHFINCSNLSTKTLMITNYSLFLQMHSEIQFDQDNFDGRSDIWKLAEIIYEVCNRATLVLDFSEKKVLLYPELQPFFDQIVKSSSKFRSAFTN